jgi:outer membrane receptor for ferrienterochelin and colicin
VADSYGITGFAWIKQEDLMVKRVGRYAVLFLVLSLLSSADALAQANPTGRLTGTVTDQRGGMIRDAEIRAKNEQTGSEFVAITNRTGVWAMNSILSGNYTVTVNAQGFRTTTIEEVKIEIGITKTVDATLYIGLEDEITVTASKYEQDVLDAPATVTVIPELTIRNSPSPNLGELLRQVAGMNVVQTSAREFNITSRAATGLFSGTQLALIDGRTIYHDDWGYICWEGQATNINEIKQVEVIRGPASAIWGPNAMNGIVNIITKSPREMIGSTLTLGIGTFDRSSGVAESDRGSLYYVNATHAQALNDQWALKIGGGFFTQDAFARPLGNMPGTNNPYPTFDNEGTAQPNLDGRVNYDFPDGKQHFIFSGGSGGTSGIAYAQNGPVKVHNGFLKSNVKVDYLRDSLKITGYVNLSGGKITYLWWPDPATGQPSEYNHTNQTYHVEFSDNRTVRDKHLISYGGNFRHNEFNIIFASKADDRSEGGAYLQDEIIFSNHFRLDIGARIDKFEMVEGTAVSPRMTFIVKPAEGQTFRISYNRAYVAPTILVQLVDYPLITTLDLGLIDPSLAGNNYTFPIASRGNRDIRKPSLNAYEIGYSAVVADGRVHLGAAFYINDSKNGIGNDIVEYYTSGNPPPGWPLDPYVLDILNSLGVGLPSAWSYLNLGKVRNMGLELDVNARINRYVRGKVNYSWQARPDPEDFDISLLNIPPEHRFNAGADFNCKRYLANVSVSYVGSAYWRDMFAYSGPTNSYTQVNAGGGVQWGENQRYTAMLKISNLGNTPIQNHFFGDILKRQITGELRIRF